MLFYSSQVQYGPFTFHVAVPYSALEMAYHYPQGAPLTLAIAGLISCSLINLGYYTLSLVVLMSWFLSFLEIVVAAGNCRRELASIPLAEYENVNIEDLHEDRWDVYFRTENHVVLYRFIDNK